VIQFGIKSTMGNAIYCDLCISKSADKARHGLKLSWGKEGAAVDRGKSHWGIKHFEG